MSLPESDITAPVVNIHETPNRIDVARAYLRAELPNIIADGDVATSVELLSEEDTWRLLEALSYAYRLNNTFHLITETSVDWIHAEIPIESIALTGTAPHINNIVYSDDIANNPRLFANYLQDYFNQHTDDDPQELNIFRPNGKTIEPAVETIITRQHDNKYYMVDGTHRLMARVFMGKTSVNSYIAIHNGLESKHMTGDSTLLTMRKLFERTTTEEAKEHILATCVMLCRRSTDGQSAIQTYWIDHTRDDAIKAAGQAIIDRLNQP